MPGPVLRLQTSNVPDSGGTVYSDTTQADFLFTYDSVTQQKSLLCLVILDDDAQSG